MEDGGIHASTIEQSGFEEAPRPAGFGPLWKSYASSGGFAHGYYHLCAPSDRWNIAIHDFTLEKDALLEFKLPEYLSITWYESISGEEFTPLGVLQRQRRLARTRPRRRSRPRHRNRGHAPHVSRIPGV